MYLDKIEVLRQILATKSKPISITEISRLTNISRTTVTRYLDQMLLTGQVRMYEIGNAKKFILATETSLHTLCDLTTHFVLILDQNLRITYVNEAYLKFTNIPRNSVIGRRIESISLDIFATSDVLHLLQKYKGDGVEYHTIEIQRNTQKHIHTIIIAKIQFGHNNQAIALIAQDITKQRKSDDEFQFLASIVKSSKDAIIGIDCNYIIISWNYSAELTFGYSEIEIIGKPISVLFPTDLVYHQYLHATRLLAGNNCNNFETQQKCKDGSLIDVSLTVSRITDKEEKTIGTSIIARNITEQVFMEKSFQKSKKKLNILTSITRHDILNQLQALDAFCDLLKPKILADNKASEYLTYISQCSENIREHIIFSKDYQELGDNPPVWQQIETMVKMAAADYLPSTIQLVIQTENYEIFADSMLMLVFYNLFDNSKRHGEHVSVITITFIEQKNGGLLIYEDNGTGVPDIMKHEIFEKGVGKNSGLGLFLVSEILSITDMRIVETGVEGEGVRFEIRVPPNGFRRKIKKQVGGHDNTI
jgi:PAS domain S-box-containing protein